MPHQSAPRKYLTEAHHESAPRKRPTKVPHESAPLKWPTTVPLRQGSVRGRPLWRKRVDLSSRNSGSFQGFRGPSGVRPSRAFVEEKGRPWLQELRIQGSVRGPSVAGLCGGKGWLLAPGTQDRSRDPGVRQGSVRRRPLWRKRVALSSRNSGSRDPGIRQGSVRRWPLWRKRVALSSRISGSRIFGSMGSSGRKRVAQGSVRRQPLWRKRVALTTRSSVSRDPGVRQGSVRRRPLWRKRVALNPRGPSAQNPGI